MPIEFPTVIVLLLIVCSRLFIVAFPWLIYKIKKNEKKDEEVNHKKLKLVMHNYSSMMKKKENKKKINDRVYTKICSGSRFTTLFEKSNFCPKIHF